MKTELIPLNEIHVEDRARTNLGDIDSLADSMRRYGLIQPIVVNQDKRLVAGGRRYAAAVKLGWTTIYVAYRETMSADELKELELEENVRRQEMDWKEKVCLIADIHHLKLKRSHETRTEWGFEQTGELLGRARSNVWYSIQAAYAIKAKDQEVLACENLAEFIKLLLKRKEQEALKLLANRVAPVVTQQVEVLSAGEATQPIIVEHHTVRVSSFVLKEPTSLLSVMDSLPAGCVDHILTDPPYAIEMRMLQQDNVGQNVADVADEHDVESNLSLLHEFFPRAARLLGDRGFCVVWADMMHFEEIVNLGTRYEFLVQRWPLVWCKTHNCSNNANSYNFTKKTEIAIVMRRKGTVLMAQPNTNYFCGTFEPGERQQFNHPFVKPAALWQWVAKAIALPGQTLLDPFAGEGSGPLAFIDAGFKTIAIECNEKHYHRLLENVKDKYRKLLTNVEFE